MREFLSIRKGSSFVLLFCCLRAGGWLLPWVLPGGVLCLSVATP